MSQHGPQFDVFTAQSGEHHGGAQHDEFHGGPGAKAGGSLDRVTDTYREPSFDGSGHGQRWDEFGWKRLPEHYGRHMDSDFREVTALDGAEGHGSLYDVFRGGNAQVRAIVDGVDVEGLVLNVGHDHATIKMRDGRTTEIGVFQLVEWRQAERSGQPSQMRERNAKVEDEGHAGRSTAEAPSAHSVKASGRGRRVDVDPAVQESTVANKTLDDALVDLRKLAKLD